MSGHSKWSKVKHQKAVTDGVKGKIFTKLSAAITLSVREGGGPDPGSNFKLRLAMEKARASNMPKENISRAIERASGIGGRGFETITYEAFGPNGVGILMLAVTDNRQRTVSDIKNRLNEHRGTLAATNAVSHLFTHEGCITVDQAKRSFDDWLELAIECGANDISYDDTNIEIYTDSKHLHAVKSAFETKGVVIKDADFIYKPQLYIEIKDPKVIEKIQNLLLALEDLDDVQKVFANCDLTSSDL